MKRSTFTATVAATLATGPRSVSAHATNGHFAMDALELVASDAGPSEQKKA